MKRAQRIDALEQNVKQARKRTGTQHALTWVRSVVVTLDDVRAIVRGDWSKVNPILRETQHADRWARAAAALLGAMNDPT